VHWEVWDKNMVIFDSEMENHLIPFMTAAACPVDEKDCFSASLIVGLKEQTGLRRGLV